MYSDENKSSSLARFLNTFDYAIIDTCSLMDEAFPEWMDALRNAKAYRKKGQLILVPRRCYDELKKHARQTKDDSKRIDARRGLKILTHARLIRLLTVTKKDKNENFADNAIYVKVCGDRLFSKILVITQDKKLASDLRALNSLKSQSGRPLEVCKIVSGARLVPNRGEEPSSRERRGHATPRETPKPQNNPKPSTSGAEEVLLNDARLSAVINNGNYPSEKKKADCLAQLRALEKLPESVRNQLSLLVPVAKLKEVGGVAEPETKPAPAKKATKKAAKPAEEPKPEPKPAQPAKEKLWYGKAASMEQAFIDCAQHYHMVFHEKSVSYFEQAHGPLDMTTEDLQAIVALAESLIKGEDRISFVYRGMTLLVQKVETGYKAWIDVNLLPKALLPFAKSDRPKPSKPAEEPKPEPEPEAKPEEKPEAKPKSSKKKPAAKPKEEEPAPEQPEAAPAEEPKPAKKPRKKAQKPAETPAEEAKPEEKPAEEAEKPAPKKKATRSKKAEADKPAEQPKPEQPKPAKKKAAKKPVEPEAEQPQENPELTKAKKADMRLMAVLHNPKYALENKIKDVKAQLELLSTLDPASLQGLKWTPSALEEWLNNNKPNE